MQQWRLRARHTDAKCELAKPYFVGFLFMYLCLFIAHKHNCNTKCKLVYSHFVSVLSMLVCILHSNAIATQSTNSPGLSVLLQFLIDACLYAAYICKCQLQHCANLRVLNLCIKRELGLPSFLSNYAYLCNAHKCSYHIVRICLPYP